uniref:Uncharacterized protein n=1 Tax=viral metagenome TaxID=1070528 RepID=A0A6C0LKD4_9ZZZZ
MSSAASISAAKRRRGAQSSVPPQSSNRGRPQQQQQQRPQQQQQPQQQQAVQRNRVNPMQILEDHEKRLRVIEGGSESPSTTNDVIENKEIREQENNNNFSILERENIELHKKIEILKNKMIEMSTDITDLKKLKDIVFTIQSSVLSNSQKVESFRANTTVSQEVSQEASHAVSQEIQDITADLETATLGYGEENKNHDSNAENNDENVTSGESVNSEVVSGFE